MKKMNKKYALYARVNRGKNQDSHMDEQIKLLKKYCNLKELSPTAVYREFSGSVSRRPEFQRLLDDVKQGKINAVVVSSLDRFSGKLEDLVEIVSMFDQEQVTLISLKENIDTSTPFGKAIMHSALIFNNLEQLWTAK